MATNKHYTEQGNIIFGLCEGEPDKEEMTARIESGHLDWHHHYQLCPNCGATSCVWVREDWHWCLSCHKATTWGEIDHYKMFLEEEAEADKAKYLKEFYGKEE